MEPSIVMKTPKTSSKRQQSKDHLFKVRVVVRVRPFLHSEILQGSGNPISCVSVLESEHEEVLVQLKDAFTSRQECFKLDSFFSEDSSVSEIFQKEVGPLISGVFHGCNATVFACGATGSGKTHTMQGTNELPGIMPMSMSMILDMCASSGNIAEISYYEVYMDKCYDLLDHKQNEISVLDDKDGLVHLRGLSRIPVSTMFEFQQILSSGIQKRKVAHTELNDISSRSHGVLVIAVSSPPCDGSGSVVVGKLNLIDLAGNEDNRRTGNEGIRLQESSKINRSLFALTNVICALNNSEPRVPYRESKLTRILQDSLGGKSRSLMVACLNPSEYQLSVNTVTLASRSRRSTPYVSAAPKEETPTVKIDMEAKLRSWLESKGKSTKSANKMISFGSPRPSKTPLSVTRTIKKQSSYQSYAFGTPNPGKTSLAITTSIKKQSSCKSYGKMQHSTNQGLANARRNLFKLEAPIDSSMKTSLYDSCSSVASKSYAEPALNQDWEEYRDCSSVMPTDEAQDQRGVFTHMEGLKDCPGVDEAKVSIDESSSNRVTSPCKGHLGLCNEGKEYKNCSGLKSYNEEEPCRDRVTSPYKENLNASDDLGQNRAWGDGPTEGHLKASTVVEETENFANIMQVNDVMQADDVKDSNGESCRDKSTSPRKDHISACNNTGIKVDDCQDGIGTSEIASMPELKATPLPEDLLEKENSTSNITEMKGTPLPDELLKKQKLPCTPSSEMITSLQNSLRKALSPIDNYTNTKTFEPKTPKTPRVFTSDGYGFQGTGTPLDKYNVRSSNLKTSLAKEYIEFLNSANKEELLKLKGIGHKRAEYILNLRETTPLESLYDLEKIGLSSRQVKSMFGRAAKGIFDE